MLSVDGFAAIAVAMLLTLAIFVCFQFCGYGGGRSPAFLVSGFALLAAMHAPGYFEILLESVLFACFCALLVLGVGTLAAGLPSMMLIGEGLMKRQDQSSIGVFRVYLQKRLPFVPQATVLLFSFVSSEGPSATAFEYVLTKVRAVLSRSSSSSSAAAFQRVSRFYTDCFGLWLSTLLSPRGGPREVWQAQATPRVDVAEVPSVPSSQQVLCVKSCFDQFPGRYGDCTPGSLVTPPPGLSFLLVTLSGKTLTMNEGPGLLVSELLDKIAVLSALPSSAFYLTFGHTGHSEERRLERDALLRMRGRLLGGTSRGPRTPQVPGSWHCAVCNLGGCWPGRDHCFRCLTPRFANARRPPRESNFTTMVFPVNPRCVPLVPNLRLSRAHDVLLRRPPSRRTPSPGHAQAVLKALKGLGLSDALLQQVHQSLASPQKFAASKLRQLAHLDEQLKALKSRIQKQTLAVERHREQGERMQEQLLKLHIEEDKLKEEFKALQNSPPSQSSSHLGTPVAASAGATPPGCVSGDASMEDPLRTSPP